MAITFTNLEHSSLTTNVSAYTTGSVTAAASKLILLFVTTPAQNSAPTSIGGTLGLTWTAVTNVSDTAAGRRTSVYRALSGAGATGTVIINLGSAANGCQWSIVEVGGSKLTGTNGADAIVQSAVANSASASTLTVTLSAFADPTNNGVIGYFNCMRNSVTWTPGTGTKLSDTTNVTPDESSMTETATGEDTTVSASWTGTGVGAEAVALEIAMATAAGGFGSLLARNRNRLVVTP